MRVPQPRKPDPDRRAAIRSRLLRWFRRCRRPLPWRGANPWGVLVSELMLQQTRVATVLRYYEPFLGRFPTPSSLALADMEEVLRTWEGLGYYRRARNLKAIAEAIVRDGWEPLFLRPPTRARAVSPFLRELPGIGAYTAAAVGSIAFGERLAAVDGNTARVFARLEASPLTGARLLRHAEHLSLDWMGRCRPGDWNQAWMELGSTVCAPKPDCDLCPLREQCEAYRLRMQHAFPVRARTPERIERAETVLCAVVDRRVAVCRIEEGPWWSGMYSFPRLEGGEAVRNATKLAQTAYTVTRHRVVLSAYLVRKLPKGVQPTAWIPIEELARLPMPAPQRRIATLLLERFS